MFSFCAKFQGHLLKGTKTFFSPVGFKFMFGIFGKKSEVDRLNSIYKKLLEESYKLSHTNRAASDRKAVEANDVLKKIESIRKQEV